MKLSTGHTETDFLKGVPDIGQFSASDKKTLNRSVKTGLMFKYIDFWSPPLATKKTFYKLETLNFSNF